MLAISILAAGDAVSIPVLALTTLVTSTIGSLAAAAFGYYRTIAEREAAHRDFERVLAEARATTVALRAIEQGFSQKSIVFSAEIAYRQRQLAELYGPIYASLKLNETLWRLLSNGKIGSVRSQVMDLTREQNERVILLLHTKFDLVEGGEIPAIFARGATAMTLFNLGTRVGPDNNNPPDIKGLDEAILPPEFAAYIFNTTEELKRKLDLLYAEARAANLGGPV